MFKQLPKVRRRVVTAIIAQKCNSVRYSVDQNSVNSKLSTYFANGLPSVSNKGLHSLHTVRFFELCQNPFVHVVTKVARTLCGESKL